MTEKTCCVIGLTGFPFKTGGFSGTAEQVVRMEMPTTFKGEGIEKSKKDFEMISQMLRNHPGEMVELLDAVVQNRIADAVKKADQIGLREHKFMAQGGGAAWLVAVAVVVAIVLVARDAK